MAKVFLGNTDSHYIVANNNTQIYGAEGNQVVTVFPGVTSLTVDQNIESVIFRDGLENYKFQSAGATLNVYDSTGRILVAEIPLQMDADGTGLSFNGVFFEAKLQTTGANLGQITIGNKVVSSTAPADIETPTPEPEPEPEPTVNLLSQAQQKSNKNTTITEISNKNTPYINTLDSGEKWNKTTITFSFNNSVPQEYYQYDGRGSLTNGWRSLTTHEKSQVLDIFTTISGVLGVKFTEVSSGGDLQFNAVKDSSDTAASAFYPGTGLIAGDVFLNRLYYDEQPNFAKGSKLYETIVHEIGHALGLKHPFDGSPTLPKNLDNTAYTVMSYESAHSYVFNATWNNETNRYSYETTLKAFHTNFSLYDVHTLQNIYGANTQHHTGSNIYTIQDNEYLLLWDAGGHDTIDLSNKTGASHINLQSGTLSSANLQTQQDLLDKALASIQAQGAPVENTQLFFNNAIKDNFSTLYNGSNNIAIPLGVVIEDVKTGSGNDIIWDNEVDNSIYTGAGDDIVYLGRGGFDYVDTGSGYDKVYFNVSSNAVEIGRGENQSIFVVADDFAAQLVGVEELVFTNTTLSTAHLFI